jgi:hypothetical protein
MSLIDPFMPAWSLRQVMRVAVAADPDRAYDAVRAIDGFRIPFVRALFALRSVPERVGARLRGRPMARMPRTARLDDIVSGTGFSILDHAPGRGVVVGAIGTFWKPTMDFAKVGARDFAAFDEPGFGKVVWSLEVDPRAGGGAWITFDLRVDATDPRSLAKFRRYWLVIGRFSHAIRDAVLRLLVRELGAAPDDAIRALPGDDLLDRVRFARTHGVTIEAPPERVWPWLVQMGAGRGGWYTIDRLDNGGVPSVSEIIPALQHLAVGDVLPAVPDDPIGFAVLRLQPQHALVIGSPSLLPWPRVVAAGAPPWTMTWAFVLDRIGDGATRLTVRVRAAYDPSLKVALARGLLAPAHEVMERTQLRNLKRRAERHATS